MTDTKPAREGGKSDGRAGVLSPPAPAIMDGPSIKASLQALETSWHGYLAEAAGRVFEIRRALASGDYDGADYVSERLMSELTRQLEALDRVRDPESVRPLF